MHNEPRQQLCKLIAQYGRSLSEDPRRCGALLKDHCGQYKREIFVLVNALENHVAEELIKTSAGVPVALLLARLTKRLEDELGLAETVAKWAVETWALALGAIDQPIPIAVPNPVQNASLVSQAPSVLTPVTSLAPSAGGRLRFPKFSVGKVKIGGNERVAVGEIDVPQGQTVELAVSNDVTDFSFLETCDPNGLVTRLNLSGCENFNEDKLVYLKNIHNLQFLDLSNCNLFGLSGAENGWNALKSLKNLYSLNLSGNIYLEDMTLKYIGDLDSLELLNLDMSQGRYGVLGNIGISDSGIGYLTKFSKLKRLNINSFKSITGPGVLSHLGNMTHLEFLNLTECDNVSPSRLQELRGCRETLIT